METDLDINPKSDLASLNTKIDELVQLCESLQQENLFLRNQHEKLINEKVSASDKYARTRTKVESMLSRLKSLEVEI